MSNQIIVVGGGLSGLSAAHTALQNGQRVVLIDKNAFLGGNSTKATSGINGAGTAAQRSLGIPDTKEIFEEDTARSATGIKTGPAPQGSDLGRVLTHKSGEAVEWLIQRFGLTLDTCSRLGGHSHPRTHRMKVGGKFPGMMITYALMEKYDEICNASPDRARLITRARAQKLITDASGAVVGVEYEKGGQRYTENGAVVITTGGYGAGGLSQTSLLHEVRPDLVHLPTTNGGHCTGDGVRMVQAIGGATDRLDFVQVHPTGLINPAMPEERTLFLAAGALRGEGGIILDKNGKRFCNDLGTRDYVTGMIWKNQGPFRLVLNAKAAKGIAWHVKHYEGRGVMKAFPNAAALAAEMGIPASQLHASFDDYNRTARGEKQDPWDKKYYPAVPFENHEELHVAQITPVVHYTMGGLKINTKAEVQAEAGGAIPGLFCGGEAAGGVHGKNRLGGSALLECVVFGRVAGQSASDYVKARGGGSAGGASVTVTVKQADGSSVTVEVRGNQVSMGGGNVTAAPAAPAAPPADEAPAASKEQKEYTLAEVAKHKSADDCWVAVNGQVLDVTEFMNDHPGGKMAIMTFAGKDATEEFNMLHEKNVVEKFAPHCVIGTLKPSSKL